MLVYFENRNELLFFWVGAACFIVGSVLDILDGALARVEREASRRSARSSTRSTDRVGEGLMLGAIGARLQRATATSRARAHRVAVAGSFLVPYTRAKAEALGLRGDVGIGSRAERVVVISAGLMLAPWGVLPWAICVLTRDGLGHGRPARPARARDSAARAAP